MNTQKKSLIISTILAFFTCYCLSGGYVLTEPLWSDSCSLLTAFLFVFLTALYRKVFFPFNRRRIFTSFIFGLPMGYMILLGARYVRDVQLSYSLWCFILAFFATTLIFTALLCLLFMVLPAAKGGLRSLFEGLEKKLYGGAERRGDCKMPGSGIKCYVIILFVTAVFYLLTFLAVYPGIYSYDASVQVLQFFGDEPVTTHHPLLHTLFLCGSLKLGDVLFGSFQAGMAIHSILQAAMVGAVFSYVIWWMINRRTPLLLVILAYLLLVVNPYMQIFVFVTTKDVLFGAVFLLLFVFSLEMVEDRELFFGKQWSQLRFFLTALLMCFLRNQGIYVLLFFGIFIFASLFWNVRKNKGERKDILKWLSSLCAVTALYLTVTGPIFTVLGVEKGDSREMLSVPMQQLARAYHKEAVKLTEEELSYIEELILPDNLEQYVSVNADPVKSGFQTSVVKADPVKFAKMWLTIGSKTPLVYADSFFMGNWGYWYPEETQYWINYVVFDGAFLEQEYNVLNIRRDSRFPAYENYLRDISLTPAFEDIPVLSVLLNQAFPFWLMLITAAVSVYFKKYRYLLPLTLLLGYWGTLLLGPVTSVRYALPLMMCVPLMFLLIMTDRE